MDIAGFVAALPQMIVSGLAMGSLYALVAQGFYITYAGTRTFNFAQGDFLMVAVVIGAAFGAVVQALVKDIITPIIGAFGGVPDFSAWFFTVNGSKFLIGDFVNALLGFVFIAAVVYYFVVLPVQKVMDRFMGEPPAETVTTKECPYCLSKVPAAATRCAYCTSELPAVAMDRVPVAAGVKIK